MRAYDSGANHMADADAGKDTKRNVPARGRRLKAVNVPAEKDCGSCCKYRRGINKDVARQTR